MSAELTSKQIIQRVVDHQPVPRIGFEFVPPHRSDIHFVNGFPQTVKSPYPREYFGDFGHYDELLAQVPWFSGEVRLDGFGNIYGRLNGITKGECIRGVLDDWDKLDQFSLPELDWSYPARLKTQLEGCDKFVVSGLPVSIFSTLRDARLMDNALADTVLETENVEAFLDIITTRIEQVCRALAGTGVDAIETADDWGIQDRTFISPACFATLFKPCYKRMCDAAHEAGLKVFMHSCGYNYALIPHLVEAGVDTFQFDQPAVYPEEVLAKEFGKQASFYLPVDIQKIMPTGDRAIIEEGARHMIDVFREHCGAFGGSLIVKDYPTWWDIGVQAEWANWAREALIANSAL